jgi:GNAT superfamily N-acetyltransferase
MTASIPPARAEQSEATALYDVETGAPAHARASLGIEALRIGGGVALSMRNDPTGFWSKALGFGFQEPVTDGLIAEISGFYRSRQTPIATIQLAPSVIPEDWPDICAKWNLSAGASLHKLVCSTEVAVARGRIGELGKGLRPGRVQVANAAEWASVVMRGSGMPEGALSEMAAASVGRPGWCPYAVWAGEEIVAGGTTYIREGVAQLFGGATLPFARGRGAQSELLTARARAAHAAGCRWLVAETGVESPGTHNSSLHNMVRMGFAALYQRQNWTWRGRVSTGR